MIARYERKEKATTAMNFFSQADRDAIDAITPMADKNPFKKQFLSDGEPDEPITRRKLQTVDTERGLLSDSPAVNDIEFSPKRKSIKPAPVSFNNNVLMTKDELARFGKLGIREEPKLQLPPIQKKAKPQKIV